METEAIKRRMNSALLVEDWKVKNDYKLVSVLVLYWQESNEPGFKDEAHRIGEVFTNDFHYDVEYFAIPLENSHRRLDSKINSLLDDHEDPDHLIIIHYGGHGDADVENERLAVWAAQSHGGPTVDWSIIQPKLGQVKADKLLILDCCFAAQAARAYQNGAVPLNVELVAACAMGVKTIRPGPHSFTTQLIKQLRAALAREGYAKVSDIVNTLAHRDSGCLQTPVHFSALANGNSTICLEPFNSHTANDLTKQESAWLTLKVSLRDVLTDAVVSDIVQWLKARPSRKVSKLTVEDVVLSTENLHQFIYQGSSQSRGPKFDHLPSSAKDDILNAWNDFRTLFAGFATLLRSPPSDAGELVDDSQSIEHQAHLGQTGALASLLELEDGLLSLQSTVQRNVMALPDLIEKKQALLAAIEDTTLQDLGFAPLLNRRLRVCFPPQSDLSNKAGDIIKPVPTRPKPFQSLIEVEVGNGRALIEYKGHGEPQLLRPGDIERREERVQLLADLLRTRGPLDFNTLRCTRWFREPNNARFGLVFEYPTGYDGFVSLRETIETVGFSQRPTLGQRFRIAKHIGEALLGWHTSANWVHQAIASYNIFFFKPVKSSNFDYSNPFLCGFEFARPNAASSDTAYVDDFEFNVYRHPSRQGAPSEYHTKYHDLYSYGILLLEIGTWRLVGDYFETNRKLRITPHKMQDSIKSQAQRRLGHCMGAGYERAVSRCLNTDFGVELDDLFGSRLAKAFEDLVLKELRLGAKLE